MFAIRVEKHKYRMICNHVFFVLSCLQLKQIITFLIMIDLRFDPIRSQHTHTHT